MSLQDQGKAPEKKIKVMPGIKSSHPYHNWLRGQTQTSSDKLGVMVQPKSIDIRRAWKDG